MTVETWLNDWLSLRAAELRPRTLESYHAIINRYIIPAIGRADPNELKPDQLRHMLAEISASGKTRTAELCYVILRCASRDLDSDIMRRVRRPSHVQVSPGAWSDQDIAIYMAALADHRHGLALSLGLVLGLRRGEICGLRWGDIDFTAAEVHICNQRYRLGGKIVDGPPKSATSDRRLPLPAPLLSRLRASRGLPGAYVCNISPSGLDAAHRALVARLGLPPIPLHGLRHSMATACIRHGGQMRALQNLLGHASYTTTANRYTHPDREMLRTAIDAAAESCYTVIQ